MTHLPTHIFKELHDDATDDDEPELEPDEYEIELEKKQRRLWKSINVRRFDSPRTSEIYAYFSVAVSAYRSRNEGGEDYYHWRSRPIAMGNYQ